jgi:pimeloyl-ACP methyl ester carboxylesterase
MLPLAAMIMSATFSPRFIHLLRQGVGVDVECKGRRVMARKRLRYFNVDARLPASRSRKNGAAFENCPIHPISSAAAPTRGSANYGSAAMPSPYSRIAHNNSVSDTRRERIYLDRFYNELSIDPKTIDEATREHYPALYARPRAMHDAFEHFGAFNQDAVDNTALLAKGGMLAMSILALGGEKSFGTGEADTLRFVVTFVTMGFVPGFGHWIMDENPKATIALVVNFLSK